MDPLPDQTRSGAAEEARDPLPSVPEGPPPAAIRRARRVTTVVFLSVVVIWVGAQALQIAQQTLFPKMVESPHETCGQGLLALHAALDRARAAAEGDLDSDVALTRFRAGLLPEWSQLEGVRKSCEQEPDRPSLDALERLRYAEENAVRREAASLAALRRAVAADMAKRSREAR